MRTICFIIASSLFLFCHGQKSVDLRLKQLVRYCDVEVQKDSLKQWVEWVETGESLQAAVPDRNEAWAKFLLSFYRHLGTVPGPIINESSLQAWSQFLTFPFLTGRILDFRDWGARDVGLEQVLGESGQGSRHLLLIPPIGFNSGIFEDFKSMYEGQFKFHEVSFPQGRQTWPYPQTTNYRAAPWLTGMELIIGQHLDKLQGQPVTIVSMGAGTYLAMKIASKYDNIQSIVALNGLFRSNLVDPATGMNASASYRQSISESRYPTELIIQFSPGVLARNYALCQDPAKNQFHLTQLTQDNSTAILRYSQEYRAQDIYPEISNLDIPILSLISVHDDQSPLASNRSVSQFWEEVQQDLPELKVTTLEIPNSRNLAFVDQPVLFDTYFSQFMADPEKPVNALGAHAPVTVDMPSALVSKRQVIETTSIGLTYSQPAMNGRKIFGELVPFGQIWRAGANAATKISFSNDVTLNNKHFLPAGEYSLFLQPWQDRWEIIFNKIANQWGAFQYKKEYDALRLTVTPTTSSQTYEYLNYDLTKVDGENARITIQWEQTSASFDVVQYFQLPTPPDAIVDLKWTQVLTDKAGDGRMPGLTDGKALSYFEGKDTLWFKYDLHEYNNKKAFALNLLIDVDADQKTGQPWFGTNTSFTFEKALTLWMQKSGSGFQGLHGIMYPEDFTTGNQNLQYANNLSYFLDIERKQYYVGVAKKDLELPGKKISVIGAVGEFQTWNDDIGDDSFATIRLKN